MDLLQAQTYGPTSLWEKMVNVWIMGGANIIQQYLNAGLVDEMTIHVAPVLLGNGTRLFEGVDVDRVRLSVVETGVFECFAFDL